MRLSSVWPQAISIDDIASRKPASSASEASSGVERRRAQGQQRAAPGSRWWRYAPATVRERMRALIAEDPEAPPLEVLRRLREEGHRLGESTFYRLHRAEREGLPKELMVRFEGVAGDSSGSGTFDS